MLVIDYNCWNNRPISLRRNFFQVNHVVLNVRNITCIRHDPTNTILNPCSLSIGLVLRRWPSIKSMLGEGLLFYGYILPPVIYIYNIHCNCLIFVIMEFVI